MNILTSIIGTCVLLALVGCGGSGGEGGTTSSSTSSQSVAAATETASSSDNIVSTLADITGTETVANEAVGQVLTVGGTEEVQAQAEAASMTQTSEISDLIDSDAVDEPLPEYEKTADVIVPENFKLAQVQDVMFSVTLPSEGYVSVCRDYEQRQDLSYAIDFDSCIHRQRVDDELTMPLSVSADIENMIAVVYFFDGSQPSYTIWQSGEQSLELIVN